MMNGVASAVILFTTALFAGIIAIPAYGQDASTLPVYGQQSIPNPFLVSNGGDAGAGGALPTCNHACLILQPGETRAEAVRRYARENHCTVATGAGSPDDLVDCLKKKTASDNKNNSTDVKADAFTKLVEYEGDLPKLYLDTAGKPTVGIGDMLEGVAAAKELPFYIKAKNPKTGKMEERLATDAEIQASWDAVAAVPQPASCDNDNTNSCYGADVYQQIKGNKVYLKEKDRVSKAKSDINEFGDDLKNAYADFDTFPDKVKLALYDMVFNLGAHKLVHEFVHFTAAIKRRDWKKAAEESVRGDDADSDRNQYVKNLLLDAATHKKEKVAECKSEQSKG